MFLSNWIGPKHWVDKDTGYCFRCGDIGTGGYCVPKPEEPKMSPEVFDWPGSYPSELPDPPKIRTPADILAEEAAKLLAEQEELRGLVNEKLPRKPGTKVEIWVGRFTSEVTAPIIAEVRKAGWLAKVEYNKLIIEFPKG